MSRKCVQRCTKRLRSSTSTVKKALRHAMARYLLYFCGAPQHNLGCGPCGTCIGHESLDAGQKDSPQSVPWAIFQSSHRIINTFFCMISDSHAYSAACYHNRCKALQLTSTSELKILFSTLFGHIWAAVAPLR